MTFLFKLLLPLLLLVQSLNTSQNISDNVNQSTVDSHAPDFQVFPLHRMKLTSSVLPAAIQMLTAYIEKLEEIQKTLQTSTQNHHTTSTTEKPTDSEVVEAIDAYSSGNTQYSTSTQGTSNTESSSIQGLSNNGSSSTQGLSNTGSSSTEGLSNTASNTTQGESSSTITTISKPAIPSTLTELTPVQNGPLQNNGGHPQNISLTNNIVNSSEPIEVTTGGSVTSEHPIDIETTTPHRNVENVKPAGSQSGQETGQISQSTDIIPVEPQSLATNEINSESEQHHNTSTSIHSNVEEIVIPNELYELTTTENEVTDIPTESWEKGETTTESTEEATSGYEININEETLVDIELVLGDKKDGDNSENGKTHTDTVKRGDENVKTQTGRNERRLKHEDLTNMKNKIKNMTNFSQSNRYQHTHKLSVENNPKVIRNITNVNNKINQNLEEKMVRNKTTPITNSAYYNKTSNIVKNTLQNILAHQRNQTVVNTTSVPLQNDKNVTKTAAGIINSNKNSVTHTKKNNQKTHQDWNFNGNKILENHLKESNFNKTSDELFIGTLKDIINEHKKLDSHVSEDVKTNEDKDNVTKRFWSLASFFQALHNFMAGDLNLIQTTTDKIHQKREDNYMKNVTRHLTFLKIFYNIEARSAQLWRYHGYSKSATKFLKSTTSSSSSEQLKLTLTRLIDRHNIKHERTIEATKQLIEELETPDSNTNKALQHCPTLRFS